MTCELIFDLFIFLSGPSQRNFESRRFFGGVNSSFSNYLHVIFFEEFSDTRKNI